MYYTVVVSKYLLQVSVKSWFPPRRLDEDVSVESVVDRVDVADLSERYVDRHFHLHASHASLTLRPDY